MELGKGILFCRWPAHLKEEMTEAYKVSQAWLRAVIIAGPGPAKVARLGHWVYSRGNYLVWIK
jgi:hypothetical protein